MTTPQYKALERVFAAEIDGRDGQLNTSKLRDSLVAKGWIEVLSDSVQPFMGGALTISGVCRLTHMGRMEYGRECGRRE
jgi:hypothetical protein